MSVKNRASPSIKPKRGEESSSVYSRAGARQIKPTPKQYFGQVTYLWYEEYGCMGIYRGPSLIL